MQKIATSKKFALLSEKTKEIETEEDFFATEDIPLAVPKREVDRHGNLAPRNKGN